LATGEDASDAGVAADADAGVAAGPEPPTAPLELPPAGEVVAGGLTTGDGPGVSVGWRLGIGLGLETTPGGAGMETVGTGEGRLSARPATTDAGRRATAASRPSSPTRATVQRYTTLSCPVQG
jgi:hypothetical protein